jgi:acyl-coenzyme A thioesterase PaaI-like protein
LRHRCDELTSAVNRIAPAVVEDLRAVAQLPRETDYERLRTAAVAEAELTAEERERVKSGAVEEELREARETRERLGEALAEYPSR